MHFCFKTQLEVLKTVGRPRAKGNGLLIMRFIHYEDDIILKTELAIHSSDGQCSPLAHGIKTLSNLIYSYTLAPILCILHHDDIKIFII